MCLDLADIYDLPYRRQICFAVIVTTFVSQSPALPIADLTDSEGLPRLFKATHTPSSTRAVEQTFWKHVSWKRRVLPTVAASSTAVDLTMSSSVRKRHQTIRVQVSEQLHERICLFSQSLSCNIYAQQ